MSILYDLSDEAYTGSYRVRGSGDGAIVEVSSPLIGSKKTQRGSSPADSIARTLLSELVNEHLRATVRQVLRALVR